MFRLKNLLLTFALLGVTMLIFATCSRNDDPTPPAGDAPTATVSSLPNEAGEVEGVTLTTETQQEGGAADAGDESPPVQAAGDEIEPTPEPDATSAVFVTLEADQPQAACDVEIALDLDGYGDIDNLGTTLGCPVREAIFEPIALNEFGTGPDYAQFMLWFSHENNIYILHPSGNWQAYEDTWQEGVDPTFSCNPTDGEPESPPLPRRGFGKLWCSDSNLQETMGMVEREERLCQHAVLQQFEQGRLLACFEDATVRYFRLFDDGRWDVGGAISQ